VKKHWKRLLVVGLIFYFVFLLFKLPAGVTVWAFESFVPQEQKQWQLYGVSGTAWSGKIAQVNVSGQTFRDVTWQLHPLSLLIGRASMTLDLRNKDMHAHAVVRKSVFGGLSLSDVRAGAGAQTLMQTFRIPALKLNGDFSLNMESLELDDGTVTDAQGRVVWSGAQTLFPQNLQLGDLAADLTTTEEGVVATLSDGGGPLEISGKAVLDNEGNYKFNGAFSSREGRNSQLGRALSMMGRPNAQGKVEVNVSGKLEQLKFLL
jgi:general secretion pathway protein N